MNIKKNIYPKLAVTGMVKNKRTYVPYLMTCICMIFVSYLLNFLRENKRISEIRGGSTLQAMLSLGSGIFCIFALIFLFLYEFIFDKTQKTGDLDFTISLAWGSGILPESWSVRVL